MRKILYSPGFGAGWSSWMDVPTKFACEYKPLINAIENKEIITEYHPAVISFISDCKSLYKEDPYLGGLDDLKICEIGEDEKYIITEYDGSESVQTRSETNWN